MTPEEQAMMMQGQGQMDPALQQEIMIEAQREVETVLKDIHDGWLQSNNLVHELTKDELSDLSNRVYDEFKIDDASLEDWREELIEAHKLARQMRDGREWAGEKISDIKYPIIATACIQFQARAMPAIVKGSKVVKSKIVGKDPDGAKSARGERVATYMSWQLADDNPKWIPDMDGTLMGLPLWGVMFKKTYRCGDRNESETIYPENLVVNYFAKDFEPRATHKVYLYPNEIQERINMGIFVDFEYGEATNADDNRFDKEEKKEGKGRDEDEPHLFLEQHRWYDLDGDGYKEPYIVTMHWDTQTIVRMSVRWSSEDAQYDEEGNVIKIKPFTAFTRIPFMPAFDGSFYCMGFGRLLSPLNHAIDTIINQILDAGKHQVRPSGFIGTGVRFGKHQGAVKVKSGEFKKIQSVNDLKSQIFQLQFGEPSNVLFQTLGLLMEASNRLASMSDVLAGEVPKGDIPAATTLSIIEQGLKVYSAVHKRIHRALKEEFTKLRRLNRMYSYDIDGQPSKLALEYKEVIDEEADAHRDFNASDYDIVPVSSEEDVSDTMKALKADALIQHYGTGRLNDDEAMRRWLEAHGYDEIDKLMERPEPQPDPMLLLEERKVQVSENELQIKRMEMMGEQSNLLYKNLKLYADAIKSFAAAEAEEIGPQLEQYRTQVNSAVSIIQEYMKQIGGASGGMQQRNIPQVGAGQGNAGVQRPTPPMDRGQAGGI